MQRSTLIFNAKEMLQRIKNIDEKIDYIKLVCVHTNGKIFVFNIFRRLADLTRSIYYADTSLEYPKDIQNETKCLFRDLDYDKPKNFNKKKKSWNEVLKIASKFFMEETWLLDISKAILFHYLNKRLSVKDRQKNNIKRALTDLKKN